MTYELLYTKLGCRGLLKGNRQKILNHLSNINPDQWAVYCTTYRGRTFHDATDELFLVDHNDSYWHNRQVKPSSLFGG